ncbi:MAG: hypothetical protein ACOY17_01405 [Pseudomonadota bacterium]
MSAYLALLRYLFISAARERLFLTLPVLIAAGAALSLFTSSSAIAEQREMAAAFFGAGSRVILIFGLIIFSCFHVRRAMSGGEIAFILSRPLSRGAFVLVYAASLGVMGMICAGLTGVFAGFIIRPPLDGLVLWSASLLLETLLMIVMALFFALTLNSAVTAVLSCAGFYALARLSGFLGELASSAQTHGGADGLLSKVFTAISMLVPRLDFFTRGDWLVHGWREEGHGIELALLQCVVFIPLILTATMIDFSRRRL